MKIRNGFVSNSSSSSFVLVGAKIKKKLSDEKKAEIMTKQGYDFKEGEEDWEFMEFLESVGIETPSEYDLYGKIIAVGSDYMEDEEFSFDDIKKDAELMKEKLNTLFEEEVEIKLYTGTYPC